MTDAVEAGIRITTLQRDPMNTQDHGTFETLSRLFESHPADLLQFPGFEKVNAQIRGQLADAVRRLAAAGVGPAFEA